MIPPDNAIGPIVRIPSSEANCVASPGKRKQNTKNLIATSPPVHETQGEVQTKKPDDTKGGCYISGGGNFRTFIDIVSLVLVLFCTVAVPYDMSFEPPKGLAMRGVDVGIEIFFLCEMFMNFITSYYMEDGSEVKSLRQTAIKYAKTWLLMDAASSVPAETASMIAEALARGTSNGSDVSTLTQLKIIRMLRLAKLLRLVKIARILEDIEFNFPFLIVVPQKNRRIVPNPSNILKIPVLFFLFWLTATLLGSESKLFSFSLAVHRPLQALLHHADCCALQCLHLLLGIKADSQHVSITNFTALI